MIFLQARWVVTPYFCAKSKKHQDERRIESIERAGNRDVTSTGKPIRVWPDAFIELAFQSQFVMPSFLSMSRSMVIAMSIVPLMPVREYTVFRWVAEVT